MKATGILLVLSLMALTGCASWNSESGVDNVWRASGSPEWIDGKTTEAEVVAALGPPSQIIALEEETVFYYLREQKQGKGLVLLLWNWGDTTAVYDRAIFFFDEKDMLTKHAYSREALPCESDD